MSGSAAGSPPKYKLCPTCRHIYPATNNFCPADQTGLVVSEDVIAGRYILAQMVGAGAMGKVYLAEDTQLGRRVALKLLNPAQDAQLRIDREAKAVGALDHDNVVRVYERGTHEDGRVYIAMEFLEGESLRQHLATQGRLPVPKALEYWLQAVRGVAAAHKKGVVHRDLKPDNLFLARREQDDGPIEQLKVLDFGIAQTSTDRQTRGTVRIGTPGYVAPEQWKLGEATARSDVYSLGVILIEMLTGQRSLAANPQAPLEALERLAIAQPLSRELRQLASEVLATEPELRPENARALLDRLRALPESRLWAAGAAGGLRESPSPVSLSTSAEVPRRAPLSGDDLQPLDADEEDADTEQVGIEALRPPAPLLSEGPRGPRPEQATVRVERLPGLVPTPMPERPTSAAATPPPPPPDLPPLRDLPSLPGQSTLIIGNSADLQTLNVPALPLAPPPEPKTLAPALTKPASRNRNAMTLLSGRPQATTLAAGSAPTLPLGVLAEMYNLQGGAPGSRLARLRAWLRSPTVLGPLGVVLMLSALLGLLATAIVILALLQPN